MKNFSQILQALERKNFSIKYNQGSSVKIYPPDDRPFYSGHIGEKAIHPLKRFAKANWNLRLEDI